MCGTFTCHWCKLDTCNQSKKSLGHYHCPVCKVTNKSKHEILSHYSKIHLKKPSCGISEKKVCDEPQQRKSRANCQLVDKDNHIYMVNMSSKGPKYPTHVKIEENKMKCGDNRCNGLIRNSEQNNVYNLKCEHMEQVVTTQYNKDDWYNNMPITEENLSKKECELLKQFKTLIKDNGKMESCISHQFACRNIICFSVCNQGSYFNVFTRI